MPTHTLAAPIEDAAIADLVRTIFGRIDALIADACAVKGTIDERPRSAWLTLEAEVAGRGRGKHLFVHYELEGGSAGAGRLERVTIDAVNPTRTAEPAEAIVSPDNKELVAMRGQLGGSEAHAAVFAIGAEIALARMRGQSEVEQLYAHREITLNGVTAEGKLAATARTTEPPTAASMARVAGALGSPRIVAAKL
jgi:hypothetical protein